MFFGPNSIFSEKISKTHEKIFVPECPFNEIAGCRL